MPTKRKLARKSSRQRKAANPSVANRRRRILEALEQRILLASDFKYNADPFTADVYLYTDGDRLVLEHGDGGELMSEALADVENIELDGSGFADEFRIGDLSGFFGTLTINGDNGRDKVIFDGEVTMADMNRSGSIDVTAEEIVIEGSADITAGDIKLFSTGNEGGLSVANNLPLDITDVIEGERKISIKSGAKLDGDKIKIEAQRIASLVSPVRPWGLGFKNAAVDIQGAEITGDEITITTTTADENLTDALPDWANNWLAGPITKFIFDGIFPTIPVAAMISSGESNITIDDSTLTASGDITVNATSTTDASTAAMGIRDAADDIKKKNAGGNVDILSNANTTAAVTSTVRLNMNAADSPTSSPTNPNEFGAAVAVTNSETTSTTTVGSEVQITATGNVNVHSIGDVTNSAKAGINIYVDGRGGLGLAVGVDNATVETRVDGKIDAGGTNTDKELVIADIDGQTDTITINDHGLKTGDELIYLAQDPNDDDDPPADLDAIGGLVSGDPVRVIVLNDDEFQLAYELPMDVDGRLTDPSAIHTFTKREVFEFDPGDSSQLDKVNDRITLSTLSLEAGALMEYAPAASDQSGVDPADVEAIGGLADFTNYVAINVTQDQAAGTTTFQLAQETDPTTPIDLTTDGVGDAHFFAFLTEDESFSPSTAVDEVTNYITIPNHDYDTGDVVQYDTDPTIQSKQTVRRTSWVSEAEPVTIDPGFIDVDDDPTIDPDLDTIRIASGHGFVTGQPVQYSSGGDSPIGGLTSGTDYFAIFDTPATFQLAASLADADAGITCDDRGRIYLSSLESDSINVTDDQGNVQTLVKHQGISWPDTFAWGSQEGGKRWLYFTTSRIQEGDQPTQPYGLHRIAVPMK